MEIRHYQVQIMNARAKTVFAKGEQNALGYMNYQGEPSIGIAPVQRINGSSSLKDFYAASSDLGNRTILSSKAKELFEKFRNDNVIYLNCPLTRGSQLIQGYWITDVIKFDDQEVDFEQSEFELCEVWVEREVNGVAIEFGERLSEIEFRNLDEKLNFEKAKLNHLSKTETVKLIMKEGCSLPFFYLKDFGIYDLIISEELKIEIQKQKMDKGLEFKPLEIPDEEWFGPNGLRKQFYK
jgi:hypothetical protein